MLKQAIASAEALNLPVEFVQADAQQLPFEGNSFDGARVDRTLQHIPDPQKAIAEMVRVLRPERFLVAMEPDWETFTIDSEHTVITRKLLNFWCDSFPAGWVGRDLSTYFYHAGLEDIQVSPETLMVNQFELADQVFDLVQTAHRAGATGIVSQQEAQDWLQELQRFDQAQEFFCSFTGFVVSGMLSRQLRLSELHSHPSRAMVTKALEIGMGINLAGLVLTLFAAQTVVTALLTKTLTVPAGIAIAQPGRLIDALDVFVVQACLFLIMAGVIGIAIAFRLLKRLHHHT